MLLGPGQPQQNSRPPSVVWMTLLAMSGLTPTAKERFYWLTGWIPSPNYQRSAITRAPLEGVSSQQTPSQFMLCVIIQRPILLSCSSSNPRVVTRQPSVSDALIHAKIPGLCCHAWTCRFYFPPCLHCNAHSSEKMATATHAACMKMTRLLHPQPSLQPLMDCGFYLPTVFAAPKYRLIS